VSSAGWRWHKIQNTTKLQNHKTYKTTKPQNLQKKQKTKNPKKFFNGDEN
jgi:hypothetical protein